jgi:hypothetical protein
MESRNTVWSSHFSGTTDAINFSCHYTELYAPVGLAQKFKLLEKDGHFNYTLVFPLLCLSPK